MTSATGIVSGSILLSETAYYPLSLEYTASTSNTSDLGLELLQLSGNFGATECLVRPSLLFKAGATTIRFVSVVPARSCCTRSKLQSVDSHFSIATAGIIKVFEIALKDAFGNVVNPCNEDVRIFHAGGPAQSTVYCLKSTAEFRPTSSGVYFVGGRLKSSAGCEIEGSKMIVQPFVRSFQESNIRGTALTLATCGQPSWVTMIIRDMFGNPQPKSESPSVTCSLNGSSAIQTVASPCPGPFCPESLPSTLGMRQYLKPEYAFHFIATMAGNFKLSIYSKTLAHVSGSPFFIKILPGSVCLALSSSSGSSLTIVTNQDLVSFVITSRDAFGNAQADSLWISVVDSYVVKQSAAATRLSGGYFRASNRVACGSTRCNLFSILLQMGPLYAT
jgi:hypothetical protein